MKLNRRGFFAALAAPLLAPMRKLLPAAPARRMLKDTKAERRNLTLP
jgi:hypothetical protein